MIGIVAFMAVVAGQTAGPPATPQTGSAAGGDDILVMGKRAAGSAIGEVEPIAVLGQDALKSLGANSMKEMLERLKPLTASSSGADPVILLNGRRISGFQEMQTIPPEAIERTEVLPESEAPRFGYPPTVRIMNFITKKRFRALELRQLGGTATEGDGETNYVEATATRIDGSRRTSLSVSHLRLNPVRQSARDILPDPDVLYAVQGNVTGGRGAASIDPRLDRLAGGPVTVAPVPLDPATRPDLAAYAAAANRAAVTDPGPFRWLQPRTDTLRVDGTIGTPIGRSLDGSLNLSMEAQRITGRNGLAPALLNVPGDSAALPFDTDVLLYRYLPGTLLRQRNTAMTLHGGGTLQGGVGRWTWNATTNYDRVRGTALADQGVVTDALQRSVDAGGDPLAPPDPALTPLLTGRSRTVTGTVVSKAVATGPSLRLPAGPAQLTLSADYARSTSSGRQAVAAIGSRFGLARTTRGASVNASLPIAAADRHVLAPLGRMNANATIGLSDVSDFGRLLNMNYGLNWAPARPVQFTASVDETQAAPAIGLLTDPTLSSPNVPFFDFATGSSVLVTTLSGGNPALAPERRRVTTLGVSVQPLRGKDLRFNIDYVDTRIRNQTAAPGATTPAVQRAFPDRFVRDAAGMLTLVDLRSINVASERDRQLRIAANLFTQIGRAPPPPPAVAPAAGAPPTPPPPPPRPRPSIFASVTTTVRLENIVSLRPGLAPLDLLDDQTLSGTGGRPRWEVQANIGSTIGAVNVGTFSRLQGPTRVRSDLASSDLRFSGRTWIVLYGSFDAEKAVAQPWAKRLSLQLTVENLLNDRIDVRNRTGVVPNRFQPAYLDPVGRSIRLGVRKLF